MGHLNELHEKYFDKGLRIIAISYEPLGKIKSVMVDELGAKFWMGSDPGRETMGPFGGGGIPHAYLIDATGKIVTNAHPGSLPDARIEELLGDTFDARLDKTLHASLASLGKQYDKGQYGKAYSGAARYAEHADRAIAADAKYLRENCERVAGFHRKLIEGAIGAKDYDTAYDDLKRIAKDFAGMEVVTWAAATRKELDADPAVANERKAWKAYLKAQDKERQAGGKAKKLKPALTAYKRLVKKYPGTRAAAMASAALARMGG